MYNKPVKVNSSTLSKRIKDRRNDLGISQANMARDLDIPFSSMCYYEHGDAVPSLDKMFAISEYLHISMDYLVGRSETAVETMSTEKDLADIVLRLDNFEGVDLILDGHGSPVLTFNSGKLKDYFRKQMEIKDVLASDTPEQYKKELCKEKCETADYQLSALNDLRLELKGGSEYSALRRKRKKNEE